MTRRQILAWVGALPVALPAVVGQAPTVARALVGWFGRWFGHTRLYYPMYRLTWNGTHVGFEPWTPKS